MDLKAEDMTAQDNLTKQENPKELSQAECGEKKTDEPETAAKSDEKNAASEEAAAENEASKDVDAVKEAPCEDEASKTESGKEQSTDASSDDKLSAILENISGLADKVEQMNELFAQKIAHTTHEEKIGDQMHAELQMYKQDIYSQLVRPILLDIIEVRDSIIKVGENYETKPAEQQLIPLETFTGYAKYDLQDILEKNNIVIYDSKEGDSFSPVKQKAIKKVETSDEELHGKIAKSFSSGYEYQGRAISPEKVAVYVYKKQENEEGEQK